MGQVMRTGVVPNRGIEKLFCTMTVDGWNAEKINTIMAVAIVAVAAWKEVVNVFGPLSELHS